jgi:hypothetical protein
MNHHLHLLRSGLIAGAILLASVPGRVQSQSKHVSTDELVQKSEVVARGKVREMKSEWDETRSRIRTRVSLSVDEYLKGGGGGTMEVFVPGGEVDGVGELYTHMARFKQDEDVVVFAEKDKKGRYRITGGNEGKFAVKNDEKTGKRFVSGDRSLEDFKADIKKSVQASKN